MKLMRLPTESTARSLPDPLAAGSAKNGQGRMAGDRAGRIDGTCFPCLATMRYRCAVVAAPGACWIGYACRVSPACPL